MEMRKISITLPADVYDIIAYHVGFSMVNEFKITNKFGEINYIKGEMKEEKKMTREEAIRKHADVIYNPQLCYYDEQLIESKLFVKGLEALGLIKFEEEMKEEKKEKNLEFNAPMNGTYFIDNKELIQHLQKQGYTVTKNG